MRMPGFPHIFIIMMVTLALSPGQTHSKDDGAAGRLAHIESDNIHVSFRYPSRFQIGRYSREHDVTGHFQKQIVLVEPKELRGHSLEAIPVGEIPTISIGTETGRRADFLKRMTGIAKLEKLKERSAKIPQQDFVMVIGGKRVYRLPGYPGPYGDQAHYYIVPIDQGRILEIFGHRYYFRGKEDLKTGGYPRTGYDQVIESIIETIKLQADPPSDRTEKPAR